MINLSDLRDLIDRIDTRAAQEIMTCPEGRIELLEQRAEQDMAAVRRVIAIAKRHGMVDTSAQAGGRERLPNANYPAQTSGQRMPQTTRRAA